MPDNSAKQWQAGALTGFTRILADVSGIAPSRIEVTLIDHRWGASVQWNYHKGWKGQIEALSVQLFLPTREAEVLPGALVHEACHVLYTDKDAWVRGCQRGREFMSLVNGLEDVRIEHLLIQSGKVPNAVDLLRETTEQFVWKGPVTEATVNRRDFLPAVLSYLGRATCNGLDLSRASDMREALNPANRDLVDRVLAAIPLLSSTQDVLGLADTIFSRALFGRCETRVT